MSATNKKGKRLLSKIYKQLVQVNINKANNRKIDKGSEQAIP